MVLIFNETIDSNSAERSFNADDSVLVDRRQKVVYMPNS
jgi:hypothetical protein